MPREVTLRHEVDGRDQRHLSASIVDNQLVVRGQDLGPSTAMVSDDGEYEWAYTVRALDIPALVAALGGEPDEDVLVVLARVATGPGSYELERLLRDEVVPSELWVY